MGAPAWIAYAYYALYALAILWAVVLYVGVPVAWIWGALYLGRKVGGRVGRVLALILIAAPLAWLGTTWFWFEQLCKSSQEAAYYDRLENVDGVLAKGTFAELALAHDTGQKDGYRFYEFSSQGRFWRRSGSLRSEEIGEPSARYVFEVFEPQPAARALQLSESRVEVRETASARVLAQGKDILLGGYFSHLFALRYGSPYFTCGPGIERGGWRGATSGLPASARYIRRDREFVRTALTPAGSASARGKVVPEAARAQAPLPFRETLWALAKALRAAGYTHPTIRVFGDIPHERAGSVRRDYHPGGGEPDLRVDADVAKARYWAQVTYEFRRLDRGVLVPRILVLQQRDAVIVKSLPTGRRDTVLDTSDLDLRIDVQQRMNRFVAAAAGRTASPPVQDPGPVAWTSPYSYEETIARLKTALAASPAIERIGSTLAMSDPGHWVPKLRPGGRATRIFFVPKDGDLMAQIFAHLDGYRRGVVVNLYTDVLEHDGVVELDSSRMESHLPKSLPPDIAAKVVADARGVIAVAAAKGTRGR